MYTSERVLTLHFFLLSALSPLGGGYLFLWQTWFETGGIWAVASKIPLVSRIAAVASPIEASQLILSYLHLLCKLVTGVAS